jgi:D-amino peptidase
MIVWICTDMEGLTGISSWDQCSDPDDASPAYRYGREQLTADANAAIAGCFDAGATEVRILDGHGRNQNRGFLLDRLDSRATRTWIAQRNPLRWEGLDEEVSALAMIGQHAMVGTVGAFLDHTQSSRVICDYRINGCPQGETGQMALYAGHFGVPLVYLSGDEAACREAERLFPGVVTTPTKKGLAWDRCELYDPEGVRSGIRRDIAAALANADRLVPFRLRAPIEIAVQWSWTGAADGPASVPGVRRHDARTISWFIEDPRDVFTWPSADWSPASQVMLARRSTCGTG